MRLSKLPAWTDALCCEFIYITKWAGLRLLLSPVPLNLLYLSWLPFRWWRMKTWASKTWRQILWWSVSRIVPTLWMCQLVLSLLLYGLVIASNILWIRMQSWHMHKPLSLYEDRLCGYSYSWLSPCNWVLCKMYVSHVWVYLVCPSLSDLWHNERHDLCHDSNPMNICGLLPGYWPFRVWLLLAHCLMAGLLMWDGILTVLCTVRMRHGIHARLATRRLQWCMGEEYWAFLGLHKRVQKISSQWRLFNCLCAAWHCYIASVGDCSCGDGILCINIYMYAMY